MQTQLQQEPRWKLIALDIAELVDAYRVVPRGIMGGYGYLVFALTMWFFGLEDPNAAQAAFASIVWGAAGGLTGWYFNTGRKWGPEASHYRYMRTDNMETFSGPKMPNPNEGMHDGGGGGYRQYRPYDRGDMGYPSSRHSAQRMYSQRQPHPDEFDSEMDGGGEGSPRFNPDDLGGIKQTR